MLGIPIITRTTRPAIAGTPVWYAEATTARTQLDINITIPAGDSRKLIVLWGSDNAVVPTSVTLDPTGTPIALIPISGTFGQNSTTGSPTISLVTGGWYLDTPPTGAQTVRITTPSAVWSVASLKVIENARAGDPDAGAAIGDDVVSILLGGEDILLRDAYSLTVDLALGTGLSTGQLTPMSGQTAGADAVVNSSFLAITSTRQHEHNGDVTHGWNATSAVTLLLTAVNILFPAGEVIEDNVIVLSRWDLDEEGTSFNDAFGRSVATLSAGSVTGGADPLLADAGTSISVQATEISAPNHVDWQVQVWSVSLYCQPRSLPATSANRNLCNKDTSSPAGGWSIEQYNDAGTSRLRAYIRSAAGGIGSAIWVGAQTGHGALSLNVAHRVDLTFDGTTARLYLDRAEVANSSDANLHGMQDNAAVFEIGFYSPGVANFDGIVDRFEIASGARSAATIAAAPAPTTITDPGAPGGITMENIPLGSLAASSTFDVDPANYATGLGGGNRDLTEISDPAGRMTFLNDGTATAQIRITTPAAPLNTVNEQAVATIAEAGGAPSNQFTISWTRQGTGGDTFPFVTAVRPNYQALGRPPFNATNPRAASVVDPMSGLEIFQILPHHNIVAGTGEMITTGGAGSGFHVKGLARHQSSPNDTSFNCDGTRLMINNAAGSSIDGQSGGPWPTGGVILRTSDWRITRFGIERSGQAFWDADDPDILWSWDTGGTFRRYNVVSGATTVAFSLSGYTMSISNAATTTNPGRNGYCRKWAGPNAPGQGGARYMVMAGRRTSDNRFVVFRVRLDNGTKSGDIDCGPVANPVTFDGQTWNITTTSRISANGQYLLSVHNGRDVRAFNVPAAGDNRTLAQQFVSECLTPPLDPNHLDFCTVNGQQICIGIGTGNPTQLVYYNIGTGVKRSFGTIPDGGNPNTTSTGNRLDLFQTYGAAGGATSGTRYAVFGKTGGATVGGLWAYRLGPNDTNVLRYICHPRGTFDGDDDQQIDPVIDPTGRYILFASNWRTQVGGTGPPCSPYIAVLPEAWYNTNNNGL